MAGQELLTPLDKVFFHIENEKEKNERTKTAREFIDASADVLYTYGPSERKNKYDVGYRHLEPGIHKTPPFNFQTEEGLVTCYVEGEIIEKKHTIGGVDVKQLSVYSEGDNQTYSVSVEFDHENNEIREDSLPHSEELKKALAVVHRLHAEYKLGNFNEIKEPDNTDLRHYL